MSRRSRTPQRPYETQVEALRSTLGCATDSELGRTFGVSRSAVGRWHHRGLPHGLEKLRSHALLLNFVMEIAALPEPDLLYGDPTLKRLIVKARELAGAAQ